MIIAPHFRGGLGGGFGGEIGAGPIGLSTRGLRIGCVIFAIS
jgi:hypothetical protein